ncbi:hypothetical protein [Methanoculleus chikugoensis]|uniref:hypothetical protein n=1 Tax=Methanoculleus chikugoensis TaxID=118126 RepID=UPI001FB41CD0|nr:hypothetical protein [Methanoculleus chikugoensis]
MTPGCAGGRRKAGAAPCFCLPNPANPEDNTFFSCRARNLMMHAPPLKFTNHRIEEYALKVTYRPEDDTGRSSTTSRSSRAPPTSSSRSPS